MKKRTNILFGPLSFLTGVLIAWFSVGQVRQVIRALYQFTTGNAFQFQGKHILLNLDPVYYSVFGLAMLSIWVCLKGLTTKQAIFGAGISGLFIVGVMTLYALIDGIQRVVSCTMCDEGIVLLHWDDLNYTLVAELGLILGLTPLILWTAKRNKIWKSILTFLRIRHQ